MRNFLIATLYIIPGLLSAQSKLKLAGVVLDSSKPLAFVTVRLFQQNKTVALQTSLSNENGNFELNKPQPGNYVISFTHTGFAAKQVNLTITASAEDLQLDKITLFRQGETLGEVVVKAQRPLIEQADDKITFNVEDDPTSKTETALDILRRTPFVSVDGNDNVKVNGQSNFKVLLNGRETSMFANNVKEALRAFPGTIISKIEVITNPSAKYDGEGIGGLINIITRKKVIGYNGTISSFHRTSDRISDYNLNGNAKLGKFGLSVFLSKGYQNPISQYNINTTVPATQTVYTSRTLAGNQQSSGGWSFGNAELDYDIDTLNTVTLYTNVNSQSGKNVSDQTITTNFVSDPSTISNYHLNNKNNNPGVSIGSDYTRHYHQNKEREFSLRFLGEFGKNDSKLNSDQDGGGSDRFLINDSHAVNDQYTIQADNILPLTKTTRLEAGLKAIMRRASSDFESLVRYDPASTYKVNPLNTDFFKYAQNVWSAYASYSFKLKMWRVRLGVRLENTNVDGNFVSSHTSVKSNYTTVLPNIQFTDHLNQSTTLVFSYVKRLQRPYINDLNPFVFDNDSLNISYGNPDLNAQTIHVVSTQLRLARGNTFAGIILDGSYSGNKILQYSSFDPTTGITKTTSLNIGKEFQSHLDVNFGTKIGKHIGITSNGSVQYSTIKNNSNSSQTNSGFGGNLFTNIVYQVNQKLAFSTLIGFWKDPQTIQTTNPFYLWNNVALTYKALKGKITISLRAVNWFEKNHDYKIITKDENFYNSNITTTIRRGGVLVLTWNFGKLKENVSKKKGINNDDLLTKPSSPSVSN